MEKYYKFIFNKFFLLIFVSFNYLSAQNMGASDDFDGDGISNFNDIDSDNDGVLDFIECAPTASMRRYNNGTAATWNGATTITADVNSTTFISAQASTGDGFFLNRIITGSANTANNVYTSNYRITGTRNDFWLLNKDGVDNNSGNVTYTFSQPIPISELIVLIEDVDYRTSGSAPTVTISLQGVGTTATTLDLTPYKSGTLDLPNPSNANNGGYNTTTGVITYNVPILGTGTNENRAYALVGNSNRLVKSIKIAYNLDEKANLYIGRVQENCDNDGDGVPNIFDLDSDGDGCPDALEAGAISYAKIKGGTYSSGTLVNSGGSTTTHPFAIVGNKTIPANYGTNGFYNSIESADTFAATYTSSYTYEDATNNSKADACKDTDGDGIPDVLDIDDDNDGILDKVECPAGFVNLVNGGGFTTDPPTPNWYFANNTSNYDTPFVGFPFGYGGTQTNSNNTGGLFDQVDGNNTNTSGFNALIEVNGLTDALVTTLNQTLVAGATYQFSYDAGLRGGSGTAGQNCILQLYNADTNTVQSVLSSIPLNSLPAYPNYQTLSGSFTVPVSGNYYLLFMNAGNGGVGNDYIIDRVAAIGSLGTSSICDLDGDGVPNYLDLDTDGDGCSDLAESSVSPSTDISTPSSTTNNNGTSYGITATSLTNSQLNPTAADVNNDGLNDSVDTDMNGIPNYSSTYSLYALIKTLNACIDTDNDGITDLIDIDDDNDGILDAIESPNCFYKESEANKLLSITTDLTIYNSNVIGNSYDNNTATYTQFTSGQDWVNKSIAEITPAIPLAITSVNFSSTLNSFSNGAGSTFKLQGYTSAGWEDLSTATSYTTTNVPVSFNNSLQPGKTYLKYRLVGVMGTSGFAGITEITLTTYQYNPSAHPKPICTNDTDGDTIPNHLDLDSDNDGCSDLKESNVSPSTDVSTPSSTTNNNGTSYGIAATSLTNSQLNPNAADANNDGLNDSVDPDKNGITNYSSSYFVAIRSDINGCTDTDGDLIVDVFDLDDDNDGVLDNVESNCSTIVINSAQYATSVISSNRVAGSATSGYGNTSSILGAPNGVYYSLGDIGSSITFGFGNNITTSGTNAVDLKEIEIGTAELTDLWLQPTPYTRYLIETNGFTLTYDTDGYAKIGALSGTNSDIDIDALFGNIFTSGQLQFTAGKLVTTDSASGVGQPTGGADVDAIWALYALQGCNQNLDTDGDGIPNRLDLDSDGDGCPDTKEAILYNNAAEASTYGDIQNGSGGAVTYSANTPNAMVPGPYGSNGFADALQSSTNPDVYKQVYSYQFIATDPNISTCDNKFLLDIDSDDDGVPDAVESPSCFYTETQAMDIIDGVTSEFVWDTANPLSNTYDDNNTYGLIPTATNIQNKALITFDLPVIDASVIDYVTLNVGASFGSGKWKLQGLDITTNTWTNLSAVAGQAMNSAMIFTFNNTLQPTVRYHTYRILGVDNVNISNNAKLIEFGIHYKNYNASLNRTKTGCNSDFDGDGVPNYIDRDTDGDGCPDAIEAGINKTLLVPANFYNTGGQVSGTHVIVGGNYGTNGMGDSVETTPDSSIINYISTYNIYARDATSNLCTDTDNDGVADPIDIDDDNDGVLDAVESPTCFYTATEANVILRINSQFASPDDDQSDRDIQLLHDGSSTLTFNFNDYTVAQNPTGSNLLTIEYLTPVKLATLVLSNRLSTTAGANAVVVGSQDGISWSSALTPSTLITAINATTAVTFTVTTALPYKYYKIQTDSVPGALAVANTVGEITSTLTSDYTPSSHPKPGCTNDTDGDGIFNHQDLDSDGDSCPDAAESGTATQAGAGNAYSGTIVNIGGSSTVENAIVGTAGSYGANGFYSGIENNDTPNAAYSGTYTYANATNSLISSCFCYKPAVTAGTVLDTNHGITSLARAGADNGNWPMIRKGAWTVLEAKTKAFVPNVLTNAQIMTIPSANLVKGMMVYNISLSCLQINIDGTATGWKCFDKQTCPTAP
ncbi:beta strand repeat-containing protein [Chryseobacterium schmidteae]|uniref:beta strand repeat-containing protein n=1 Tax=Chryseobacterium schmidteae TaxID=2730404 RepID=UPI00158CAD8A|nr:hypothetical protein [Chryseobacterium schmidteae]